jgi:hypothetical protein
MTTERDAARFSSALRVMHDNQMGFSELREVRNLILAGLSSTARTMLVDDFEITPNEADILMAYLDPAVVGKRLRFEEIAPSEMAFADVCDCYDEDECDPLRVRVRYFARRGVVVGEAVTSTTFSSGAKGKVREDKIFFDGEMLDPEQLHQVWRVVPAEAEESNSG